MSKTTLLPYIEATFAVIVWGISFVATKVVLYEISPVAALIVAGTLFGFCDVPGNGLSKLYPLTNLMGEGLVGGSY